MKRFLGTIAFLVTTTLLFVACDNTSTAKNNDSDTTSPNVATTTIGNGKYVLSNFITSEGISIGDEKVAQYVSNAETHIKGMANDFATSLNGRPNAQAYFSSFISNVNSINFTKQNYAGFDDGILDLSSHCEPIFENIIQNIDTTLDRYQFIRYYQALSNEVYKYGLGDRFTVKTTNHDPEGNYNYEKEDAIEGWIGLHDYNSVPQPFDMQIDIENNNCKNITAGMDTLLTAAANNMGNGITAADLRQVINLAFNINSLDTMHDTSADLISTHKTCDPVENRTLIDVMISKANNLEATATNEM